MVENKRECQNWKISSLICRLIQFKGTISRDHFRFITFYYIKVSKKLPQSYDRPKIGYFASWPRVIFSVFFSPFLLHQCIYREHTLTFLRFMPLICAKTKFFKFIEIIFERIWQALQNNVKVDKKNWIANRSST